MTPLTAEQALGELRKFAGIQFDPVAVDAFVRTKWVDGISDPGRTFEPRPIPLIAQAAGRMTKATAQTGGPAGGATGSAAGPNAARGQVPPATADVQGHGRPGAITGSTPTALPHPAAIRAAVATDVARTDAL